MDSTGSSTGRTIGLGDPAPWFSARSVANESVELHLDAGRWIILSFNGPVANPRSTIELQALINQKHLFDADRLVAYGILIASHEDMAPLAPFCSPSLTFIADSDGALSRLYGADAMPRTIILDPMLRTIANVSWDHPEDHAKVVAATLAALPEADQSAGMPLTAPVLIVPRVFERGFCQTLVSHCAERAHGSADTVNLRSADAEANPDRGDSRRDLALLDPELRAATRERIARRLVPEIERYFQFSATRMDRCMLSYYESDGDGTFPRHRDNSKTGARHWRFAAAINLNNGYDGCDLVFPEFGRRTYRVPVGGGIVYSCGALHQLTPITRGRRYAFAAYLYGEEDAALRKASNVYMRDGNARYTPEHDLLFPELRAPSLVPDLLDDRTPTIV